MNHQISRAKSAFFRIPRRNLNLHEYQSKGLMAQHQITTQRFKLATTPEEAEQAFHELSIQVIKIVFNQY